MQSRSIDVLGRRVRVLEEDGRGNRDPVLLVHGVGGWAENWREVLAPLAATGRRVIALDLPGFGESERPGEVSYFRADDAFYPRFLLAAMEVLGLQRAHLCGNSLGGAVAYETAVTAPERIRSLLLVSAAGFGTDIALYWRIFSLPGMGLLAHLPQPASAARAILRTCFYDPTRITTTLYAEAERYGQRSFPEFIRVLGQGANLRGVRTSVRDTWLPLATRYAGPVLVVWGSEDQVLPVTHVEELRARFPQADICLIERCGHLPMAERPDEFLRAVLPFLDRAEQADSVLSREPREIS